MSISAPRGLVGQEPVLPQYPYRLPPFTSSEMLVIEAALRMAWARVSRSIGANATEPKISERLIAELDRMMNLEPPAVPGFDSDTFETPSRGQELVDFTGAYLEKRPDITLRKIGRYPEVPEKTHWALFVECKILDEGRTAGTYCRDGLMRFVDGKYAWAVSSAMMLGYCREGYSLPQTLERHFERKIRDKADKRRYHEKYCCVATKLGSPLGVSRAWISEHRRDWSYPSPNEGEPGPVSVTHLWLDWHT